MNGFIPDLDPTAEPMSQQYRKWEASQPPHFIQPKITGYRQLSQAEVDLMNDAKALAEQCGALVAKLREHADTSRTHVTPMLLPALDQRWISMGASDLQVGFMKLVRGIAQPSTF